MKLLKTQGLGYKIAMAVFMISTAFSTGLFYGRKSCPPTNEIKVKNKAKRGASAVLELGECDYVGWYKGLSNRERKKLDNSR